MAHLPLATEENALAYVQVHCLQYPGVDGVRYGTQRNGEQHYQGNNAHRPRTFFSFGTEIKAASLR